MINSQWLKLSMSRINFYGRKDERAIEALPDIENTTMQQRRISIKIKALTALEGRLSLSVSECRLEK